MSIATLQNFNLFTNPGTYGDEVIPLTAQEEGNGVRFTGEIEKPPVTLNLFLEMQAQRGKDDPGFTGNYELNYPDDEICHRGSITGVGDGETIKLYPGNFNKLDQGWFLSRV